MGEVFHQHGISICPEYESNQPKANMYESQPNIAWIDIQRSIGATAIGIRKKPRPFCKRKKLAIRVKWVESRELIQRQRIYASCQLTDPNSIAEVSKTISRP